MSDDDVDVISEDLISKPRVMIMGLGEEFMMRRSALCKAVEDAEDHGLPAEVTTRVPELPPGLHDAMPVISECSSALGAQTFFDLLLGSENFEWSCSIP